tara:strand:+ start:22743 stop:23273 length:531 start_codon:yes stop_codon:yes gene_type:complete
MNFNTEFNKYAELYLENTVTAKDMGALQGDQVVFIKNWEKLPYFESLKNTSTGERIRSMIEQGTDPLIVTAIRTIRPTAFGGQATPAANEMMNENEYMATVSQQYALGLYSQIVEVPLAAVQRVDNGNNLTPLSTNQNKVHKQTKGETPTIDPNAGEDPRKQTNAAWKDQGGKLPS